MTLSLPFSSSLSSYSTPSASPMSSTTVLVGRRVVAAGGFVAAEVGVFPVDVDVAAGDGRRHAAVFVQAPVERFAAATRGALEPVDVERRRPEPGRSARAVRGRGVGMLPRRGAGPFRGLFPAASGGRLAVAFAAGRRCAPAGLARVSGPSCALRVRRRTLAARFGRRAFAAAFCHESDPFSTLTVSR